MATQTSVIRGKIARILSEREVALNVGAEHGVEFGMFFDILSGHGLDISDPDTGEVLGSFPLPKARVRVAHVYDKFSVARTYRKFRVNVVGKMPANPFVPPEWDTRYEKLKVRDDEGESDDDGSYVDTGDHVVQVSGDDA